MICFAPPPTFDPIADAPTGSRITIYELAEAGLELHSSGVLDEVVVEPSGATFWILRDESTGVKWPFALADIRDWEYDDVRPVNWRT